jgi:hypothetical protein
MRDALNFIALHCKTWVTIHQSFTSSIPFNSEDEIQRKIFNLLDRAAVPYCLHHWCMLSFLPASGCRDMFKGGIKGVSLVFE